MSDDNSPTTASPRKPRKPKHDIELIVWRDAVADSGWKVAEDIEPTQEVFSIGLLVVDTEDHIVLGGSWGGEGDGLETNNRITIPTAWVKSRKKVRV